MNSAKSLQNDEVREIFTDVVDPPVVGDPQVVSAQGLSNKPQILLDKVQAAHASGKRRIILPLGNQSEFNVFEERACKYIIFRIQRRLPGGFRWAQRLAERETRITKRLRDIEGSMEYSAYSSAKHNTFTGSKTGCESDMDLAVAVNDAERVDAFILDQDTDNQFDNRRQHSASTSSSSTLATTAAVGTNSTSVRHKHQQAQSLVCYTHHYRDIA
ncbi:hypothetical protein GPALN_014165 [Globodera pallida]|nr:hypothetical protein GPALN_014165 [Globodera pallida]